MDYKEKYEKALEWAKSIYPSTFGADREDLEHFFPELAESEDERIKREILELVSIAGNGNQFEEIKDWLEKQGEQKPYDQKKKCIDCQFIYTGYCNGTCILKKVEPKFKVGDWIVDKSGLTQQVLDFRGGIYTCTYNGFTTDCESNYHLWTIQDAKSGDVLASKDGNE